MRCTSGNSKTWRQSLLQMVLDRCELQAEARSLRGHWSIPPRASNVLNESRQKSGCFLTSLHARVKPVARHCQTRQRLRGLCRSTGDEVGGGKGLDIKRGSLLHLCHLGRRSQHAQYSPRNVRRHSLVTRHFWPGRKLMESPGGFSSAHFPSPE